MKKINISRILIFILQSIIFALVVFGISVLITVVNESYISVLIFVLYILNCAFALIIIKQNRQIEAKMSWIYLILFIPVIGHFIFLAFGFMTRNKIELKLENDPKYKLRYYESKGIIENANRHNEIIHPYERIREKSSLPGAIDIYPDGYRFYEVMLEQIKKAKKSIFIITYIIKKSEIATEFIELLKEKALEGVEIKWLIDDFGAVISQKHKIRKLKKLGVQIGYIGKIYYPFINSSSFSRNHQKFILIDSSIVFSGGNNISDEYASLSKKYGHWIDVNYRIVGPYVNNYNLHFVKMWKSITHKDMELENYLYYKHGYNLNNFKNDLLFVSDSPSFEESEAEFYWLKMFAMAKKSIKIATPYFSITSALNKQIILALKSGVDVEIFIPGLPDKKMVYKITLNQLNELRKYGLKIWIYKDHFLHSKMGLIDNEITWMGTNNMDSRSMFSQYETMDIIAGEATKQINQIFEKYRENCIEISNLGNLTGEYNVIEKFIFDLTKPLI